MRGIDGADEELEPVRVPRVVVRGTTKPIAPKRPWVKIGVVAAVIVLGVGILLARRSKPQKEYSGLPRTLAEVSAAKAAATPEAPSGAAAVPVAIVRSGLVPGMYAIKSVKSEQLLEVHKYDTSLGARILAEPGQPGGAIAGNQRWIFRLMGPNTWEIISFQSLKALEVDGKEDTARLGQGKLTGNATQLWRLEPEAGAFRIVALGSGKALTLLDAVAKGAQVGQRAAANCPEQLWRLESHGPLPSDAGMIFAGPSTGKTPPAVVATPTAAPSDGRFVAIPFGGVANADSREGLFRDEKAVEDSVHPTMAGWIRAGEVPFEVLPPAGKNLVLLVGGQGTAATKYPARVEIPMGGVSLTRLHFLGGVAARGYPWGGPGDDRYGSVMVKVIVVRKSGEETMVLRNGVEFAEYSEAVDVPGSAKVVGLVAHGRQVRTFSKTLTSREPVEKIVLQGYAGHATPVFVAMTGETR